MKIASIISSLVLVFALSACNSSKKPTDNETEYEHGEKLREKVDVQGDDYQDTEIEDVR